MPSRKLVITSLSILLFIGISYGGYEYFSSRIPLVSENTHESEVVSGEFVDTIRVTGTAKLAYEQKLRFSGGGKVSGVFVKPGQQVKKNELLAQLDMSEFRESITQAGERVSLATQKLKTAREKIGGLELQKLQVELGLLESKRLTTYQDLQKNIQTAPLKTETKTLERQQKKSEIASKETAYILEYKLWEKDVAAKESLASKKIIEAKKIVTDTLQNAVSDVSEIRSVQTSLNIMFGFDRVRLTSEEGIKSEYVAWNAPGLRYAAESAWKDTTPYLNEIVGYIENLRGASPDSTQAMKVTDNFILAEEKTLEMLEYAKKALDTTEPRGDNLTLKDIESLKSTINGLRTSTISRLNTRRENKNLLPLISSDDLIRAQVDKDLADKKLALDGQKIALEKLKIELIEIEPMGVGSGKMDISVKREIDTKRQELKDLDIQIATKQNDIKKQSSGTSDDIVALESELKQAQSELNKALSKKEQYELHAPIDGMIRSVKILPGDTFNSTLTGNEGTIVIEDNNAVMVVAKLGQKDIVRIRQNEEAHITIDAFPNTSFSGTITEISSSPDENTNGSETLYEIRILFDRGEYAIYSGMSANIEIYLSKKDNTIFVPLTSITTDATTGTSNVTVILSDGSKEKRTVTLGRVDGERVEVLSGIVPGEKVLSIDFSAIDYKGDMKNSSITQ